MKICRLPIPFADRGEPQGVAIHGGCAIQREEIGRLQPDPLRLAPDLSHLLGDVNPRDPIEELLFSGDPHIWGEEEIERFAIRQDEGGILAAAGIDAPG